MTDLLQYIHNKEKNIARELTKMATVAIRSENRFVSWQKRKIRSFIYNVDKIVKEEEFSPERSSRLLWRAWRNELVVYTHDIREYFSTFEKYSEQVAKEVEDMMGRIEARGGELAEAVGFKPSTQIFRVDKPSIDRYMTERWTKDGKTWFERIEEMKAGAGNEFKKIFDSGLKEGLGYPEIVRNARKKLAIDAVRLEKIVRTEGQRIQNSIAISTYAKNQKYISGVEYTATLDLRTCVVCGSYDRNRYYFDGAQYGLPDFSDAPFIPAHVLCRCFYSPISKFWEKHLGRDWERKRASKYGPVTGDYNDFLRTMERVDPGWVKTHLGKFYDKWKAGASIKSLRFTPQTTIGDFLKIKPKRKRRPGLAQPKPEKPKPEPKKTPTAAVLIRKEAKTLAAFEETHAAAAEAAPHMAGAIDMPSLYHELKRKKLVANIAEFQALLHKWKDEGRITTWLLDSPRLEKEAFLGMQTERGLEWFVLPGPNWGRPVTKVKSKVMQGYLGQGVESAGLANEKFGK